MSFGWDYPAGVTGNEYEIAGPDREWEQLVQVDHACSESHPDLEEGFEGDVEIELSSYGSEAWGTWKCPTCGDDVEFTADVADLIGEF